MNQRKLWTVGIFLFVVGDGLAMQVRGALLPNLATTFAVSEGLLGLVAPAGTVGFLVVAVAVGAVSGRLDARYTLLFGTASAVVFLVTMSRAPTYTLFLIALLGQGAASGLFRGLDRAVLSHLYPTNRGRLFNAYALAWAVGAAAAPLVVNAALAAGRWQLTFLPLAAMFLPVGIVLWHVEAPATLGNERSLDRSGLETLLRRRDIRTMAVALLLSGGIEGAMFTWLPYFAAGHFSQATANLVLSGFLVAYVPGRLVYSYALKRVAPLTLVLGLATAAVPVLLVAFVVGQGVTMVASVVVAGVLISGFFPTLSAFGVDSAPEYSGPANAISLGANFAGISIVPVLLGLVTTAYSIAVAMQTLIVLMTVLAVVLVVGRHAAARPA